VTTFDPKNDPMPLPSLRSTSELRFFLKKMKLMIRARRPARFVASPWGTKTQVSSVSTPEQWRWTDDEGVQRLLRGDELRAAIADGRLKPTTLVWRRGMKSWVPAATVPELMDELNDGPDTITKQRPKTLGLKAPPTPSIPPPGIRGPQNMVDIAALRAATGRGPVSTLMGVGEKDQRPREPHKSDVAIPAAPKIPRIDGGWRDGAARPQREEDTVTALRTEDDPTTLGEANQPPKPAQKRSIPPPLKRTSSLNHSSSLNNTGAMKQADAVPPKTDTRRPPPIRSRATSIQGSGAGMQQKTGTLQGVNKTWVSPRDKPHASVPPPVGSSEVLSEAFERRDAATKPMARQPSESFPKRQPSDAFAARYSSDPLADAAKVVASPVGSAAGSRQLSEPSVDVAPPEEPEARPGFPVANRHPSMPTGPLPEMRPPEGSRPPNQPPFANEPWQARSAASSGAAEPGASVQLNPRISSTSEAPGGAPAARAPQASSQPPAEPRAEAVASLPPMAFITGDVAPAPRPPPLNTPTELPPRALPRRALTLPYPMVAGLGALLALFMLLSFALGRMSAPAASDLAVTWAKTGWVAVPGFARSRSSSAPAPRQCLMLRAPARFASQADKSIPVEAAAAGGDKVAFGFARTPTLPAGILVDPATGTSEPVFKPEEEQPKALARIVPMVKGSEVEFGVTLEEQAGLVESVYVPAPEPFVLGFDAQGLMRASPGGEATKVWDLAGPGTKADSLRAVVAADQRVAISYRLDNKVFYGLLDASGAATVAGALVAEPDGADGRMGKPAMAVGADMVSLVFAQKPSAEGASYELRWARAALGEPLKDPSLVELPPGGPGGDAGAPDIASLGDGRWLLMWTEGRQSIRAQTYDRRFRPIGEALRVSPETGNFGQGALAVVGDKAVVVFLLQTGEGYEIWGTVLQCG
jgi:hypothetical protein